MTDVRTQARPVTSVRVLRTLGGLAAGGVASLLLAVVVSAVVGRVRGYPGPGSASVGRHAAAAAAVVIAQWWLDRSPRRGVAFALFGMIALVALELLWTQWWR